jgi:nifR3 family TIM-barrel protein
MVVLTSETRARLAQPLRLGAVTLHSRVLQSPLSGITDLVFRRLVRQYAPQSMLYTEMIHASGLKHTRKHSKIMDMTPDEQPVSIQLFDCRPDFMAEAARIAVDQGAQTIDINMGCPVNKITKRGGGSSLLRDRLTAEAIVRAVVQAVNVPVTVKTRIGWSEEDICIVQFARQLEEAGAAMITVHGRTRAQGYEGPAQWQWIAQVKQQVSIPVIANGDITSVDAAIQCLEQTQADGVMCARGSLGYPFLVGEIDHFLKTGDRKPPVSVPERLACAQIHLQWLWEYKGDRGLKQARKHLAWYCRGFSGAVKLRNQLVRIQHIEEGLTLLDEAIAYVVSPSS